ncbi:hypothetical protein AALA80_16280, partial [Oscillospiraceae bacterium 50-60]
MAIMMAKASRLPLPMPRWAMIYSPSRDMNTPVNTAAPRRMQINIGFFGAVRSAWTGGKLPGQTVFSIVNPDPYFAALAARMASVSMGVTLNRSPQMP